MAATEWINGQESHASNWGKFYVKGLEAYGAKEDFPENRHDRHCSYQGYVALDIPDGTVFTIFDQHDNKHGTAGWGFSVAVIESHHNERTEQGIDGGKITGRFRVVAHGEGKIKAPRLMDWWTTRPADVDPLAYAEHCAAHIEKRGLKMLPPLAPVEIAE
jgi:hypothetical protein